MKGKKILSLLLCLLLVLTVFAGCGKSDKSDKTDNTPDKTTEQKQGETENNTPTEPIPVRVIIPGMMLEDTTDPTTGNEIRGLATKTKAFHDANPGIKVVYDETTWEDVSQKSTLLSASGEVDVLAGMGPYIFARDDWTQDVTDLFNKEKDEILDIYIRDYSSLMINDKGEVKALLQSATPFFIVYNKKIFDDFGVEYLSSKPTYEEILEKATKMTGKNPRTGEQNYGIAPQAIMGKYGVCVLFELLYDYFEGHYYEMNSPWVLSFDWKTAKPVATTNKNLSKSIEALFELLKLAPPQITADQGNENFYLPEGNVAIQIPSQYFGPFEKEIASGKTDFYDNYGVTTEMKRAKDGIGGYVNTGYVGMAKGIKTEKREAAWEVMKYLASLEFNIDTYKSLVLPVVQKGAEKYKYPADKHYDILQEHIKTLPPDQPAQISAPGGWAGENLVVDEAFKLISGQKITVEETAQKLQKHLETELKNKLEQEGN